MSEPDLVARADWPLVTDRLTIRPATPDDLPATFAYRSLEEVARWLPRRPTDPDQHVDRMAAPERLAVTLVMEHEGVLVGDLMLLPTSAWAQAEVADDARGSQAELGWVLAPAYAGRGLATEAVAALLDLCFGPLALRRVTALCFADNEPSWRLMERLGMRREQHTVGNGLHRDGTWRDGYGYAILAEEWTTDAR